jgi:outer membrane scaffolding protein for murein synthesis (MipA/OmpV family)
VNKFLGLGLLLLTPLIYAEPNDSLMDPVLDPNAEQASDVTESHWGIGFGFGWINDYPGAAQGRTRYLAVPTYKGKTITIDRQEGVRGDFISESRVKFSVSFSFLFPTDSRDIPVRSGMPDLDWTLQLGPELQIYIIRNDSHTMFLRLPFRFVASTDFDRRFESREWNFAPSLRNVFNLGKGYGELATRLELDYASEGFNDYFYEVTPQFATAQRPAFNAQQGLMNTTVGINYSYYDMYPWIFFIGGNLYFMGDAKNKGSALLVKNRNASFLAGIIRYF